jgi:ubiquinol-cytochrome c reductase iron-sulfur subunit
MSDQEHEPVPAGGRRRRPTRRMGRPPAGQEQREAATVTTVADLEENPPAEGELAVIEREVSDPAQDKRSERVVAAFFVLSALATVTFLVTYAVGDIHTSEYGKAFNYAIGAALTVALIGIGAGMILWVKKLIPHEKVLGSRHPMHSDEEKELVTEGLFLTGLEAMGILRRPMLRRSLLMALGLLPLPALFLLRDMWPGQGTNPARRLRGTAWTPGVRLVDIDTGQPVKLGDIGIGGFITAMPEGATNAEHHALAATTLLRLPPGVNHPLKGRKGWAVDNQYVAYSRICTHVGCPVGLYERRTHYLFCPCHQSTFDVPNGCNVIFGPAVRALPQLPIYVDKKGYFRAQSDYHEPVGPSFWERRGEGPRPSVRRNSKPAGSNR